MFAVQMIWQVADNMISVRSLIDFESVASIAWFNFNVLNNKISIGNESGAIRNMIRFNFLLIVNL